jgi:hypothetical protein
MGAMEGEQVVPSAHLYQETTDEQRSGVKLPNPDHGQQSQI